ncbi:MAG TPA: DUF4337 family protein [Solirubrobacterales bacterium]|nr:DUF4337 family protein [Solirubrobacterales bacterium]
MPANKSIERFEAGEHVAGEEGNNGLARQSALLVAVLAALLAVATFLSNESVKEVITGETHRAETSVKIENNQLKIDVAQGAAAMLRVLGDGAHQEKTAARAALAQELEVQKSFDPTDRRLTEEEHHDEQEVSEYNTKHLLFELAQVGLEVGIVLATVAIVARRRWLLTGGIIVGIVGTTLLAAGFVVT